jgi:4-hydroxy-tetrahydrodipicolinate reductase
MLVSSNFASGFEAFRLSALDYMARMPAAAPSILEIYHARRADEATTTSRQLARQLRDVRGATMGVAAPDTPVVVHRRGAEAEVTEIHFEMGSAAVVMTYRVHTLTAYAHGAIAAAAWLISTPRAPGCYALTDSLTTIKEGRTA